VAPQIFVTSAVPFVVRLYASRILLKAAVPSVQLPAVAMGAGTTAWADEYRRVRARHLGQGLERQCHASDAHSHSSLRDRHRRRLAELLDDHDERIDQAVRFERPFGMDGGVMLANLLRFPCTHDKVPLTAHGFLSARVSPRWDAWPLVGVPTGAASGFDVLDIDPPGRAWYDANFSSLPTTRAHETRRGGLHLLFRHAEGLRCSAGRVAAGVDVRAEGGFVIWWPREGLAVEDAPICEWPDWLLAEAMEPKKSGPGSKGHLNTSLSIPRVGHDVGNLTEALLKLDPGCWNGKYDEWLALMTACRFVGIEGEAFVAWSVGDPDYANDGEVIARLWEHTKPTHGGALFKALSVAGIKVRSANKYHGRGSLSIEVPLTAEITKKGRDWRSRFNGILRTLRPTERSLFTVACMVAELMAEIGKPKPSVAMQLLEAASPGLRKTLGPDEVKRTISNGFRHVEEKLLSEGK
jgi:hypothetical protein